MVRTELRVGSEYLTLQQVSSEFAKSTNSGGYGSSGADGAAGGNVFVTVHEEDTDLLLPLEYDVSGGAGGASGEHGEPGDGGTGGLGGEGYVWYVPLKCKLTETMSPHNETGRKSTVTQSQPMPDLVAQTVETALLEIEHKRF